MNDSNRYEIVGVTFFQSNIPPDKVNKGGYIPHHQRLNPRKYLLAEPKNVFFGEKLFKKAAAALNPFEYFYPKFHKSVRELGVGEFPSFSALFDAINEGENNGRILKDIVNGFYRDYWEKEYGRLGILGAVLIGGPENNASRRTGIIFVSEEDINTFIILNRHNLKIIWPKPQGQRKPKKALGLGGPS